MNENPPGSAQDFLAGSRDAPPEAGSPGAAREHEGAAPHRMLRRWRPLVAAAAVAVTAVAVTAGGVTAALLAAPGSHAPSALATVTGALTRTAAHGYTFSLDTTGRTLAGRARLIVVSGTLDPGGGVGAELLTTRAGGHSVQMQIRFIGRYVYTWLSPGSGLATLGRAWDKALATAGRAPQSPGSFVSDLPVSPAELSGVLRFAGVVHDEGSASGSGWTGTKYAFTTRVPGEPGSVSAHFPGGRESVSGTVYLDRQGRVRRLVTITTRGRLVTRRDLTFSNFGAPVPVTAPPARQVRYTSAPYWGFYF
jgi:hypothetical protein